MFDQLSDLIYIRVLLKPGPRPRRPGARFSKAPKTFRARKAIFNCLYLKMEVVYRHETLYEGNVCSY